MRLSPDDCSSDCRHGNCVLRNLYITMTTTFQLIVMLCCVLECCCMSNDFLGLAIPTEPTLDANTVCKTFPDLTHAQYRLCSKYPEVVAAAIQGIQLAVHECQHQFRSHRWNCSSLEKKNKNPQSSPLLERGFKETAFAYAISAAGMVTQISHACSMGKLPACGCVPRQHPSSGEWQWSGCQDNVHFADRFTRKFLDAKEVLAKDFHSQINVHNNKAGRLIVRGASQSHCKCLGLSGSCEVKTCWKVAPPIRTVGHVIKKKYKRATKMDNSNHAKATLMPMRRRRRLRKRGLIYFEKSPNFCERDAHIDSAGTRGRFCNRSSKGIDNCETLCCGRGYNTLKMTRKERCNCRFHWCCYVVCQKCVRTEWVTVCK